MSSPQRLVRDVSDTAHWAAFFRAKETERKDALFRDPLAARLAGELGAQIAARMSGGAWAWAVRTYLFDEMIGRCVEGGADTVVNLAAGLDARPYRMALPPSLCWIEVDMPEVLTEKERLLAGEKPVCRLERVGLDLADVSARRSLFRRIGGHSEKAAVISEGFLLYLSPDQVGELAGDLAAEESFRDWLVDLASPGLLDLLQRRLVREAHEAAPMQFGPAEGPLFFIPYGWQPVEVCSLFKTAARKRRLNLPLRFLALLLPESKGRQGSRPWGGVCRLERGSI